MSLEPKLTELMTGQVGSLSLRIPIITVGAGEPRLALLCGVHGDETAGVLICREFIRILSSSYSLNGSISVLTSANPFAQSTRTRVSLLDFSDLNRVGRGRSDGNLTERVAHALYEHLSEYSFIIDLHEFEMDTLPMAIYIPSGDVALDLQIRQSINAFSPATVWAMDIPSSEEMKYSRSLLASLIARGVPGFAIESARESLLLPGKLREIAEGLIEVCKVLRLIEGLSRQPAASAYARTVKSSDQAGIWTPITSLMSRVRADEKVGELISLDLISHSDVVAPADGVLIQRRGTDLVATGTNLFTVGVERVEVSMKFRNV